MCHYPVQPCQPSGHLLIQQIYILTLRHAVVKVFTARSCADRHLKGGKRKENKYQRTGIACCTRALGIVPPKEIIILFDTHTYRDERTDNQRMVLLQDFIVSPFEADVELKFLILSHGGKGTTNITEAP